MGTSIRPRLVLRALAAAVLLGAASVPLAAQATGTIRGRVTESGTQRALAGAQVSTASGRRAVTDAAGSYTIPNVEAGTVNVTASLLGFAPVTRSVNVAAGQTATADFTLVTRAIQLEQIVVTGTPGGTERRAIGNAVSTINAEAITEVAPVNTVTQLLQARTPGLTIMQPSGTPGTASSIRIRGTGSYSAGNFPIFYIDGIRMNAGTQGGFGVGGQSLSALDAVNPDDIESIEVIKGPAAATLYGAEAAAGVIQIITKKGRRGQQGVQFDVKAESGYDEFHTELPTNFATCTAARVASANWPGCTNQPVGTIISANPLRQDGSLDNGEILGYSASARGGGERFSFYVSGDREENDGVFVNSYFNRTTGRGNFFVTPSSKVDITANISYTRSDTRLPLNDNASNGWMRNGLRGTPGFFNPNSSWALNWAGLGPEQMEIYNNVTRGERFIFGATANYQPVSWFRNRVTAGLDAGTRLSTLFYPRRPQDLQAGRYPYSQIASTGYIDQYAPETRNWTLDYSGTISPNLSGDISSDLSFGMQLNAYRFESLEGWGEGLTHNGVRLVGAAQVTYSSEGFEERNSLGVFVQEQLGWRDRLYLTGALRADDNSTFGSDFNYVLYPKAALSYVISEEPFFNVPLVNQLKLRAAWGQAGNSPDAFSADRTFTTSVFVADAALTGPAVRTSAFGNPNLKAETGSELELGFDAGLFDDRLAIEATYYNKKTYDALIPVSVAPSSGFTGSRLENVGEIANSGFELQFSGTPVTNRFLTWDLQLGLSTNKNRFVTFGGTREDPILVGYGGGTQWINPGFPLASYWGYNVRRNTDGSLLLVNGNPVLDTAMTYIGPSVPTREASLSSTFTLFRNLRLYAFADYKGGHYLFNMTGQTRHADGNAWSAVNPDGNADEKLIRRFGGTMPWIEKADFVKLREIAATYTVPRSMARRFRVNDLSLTVAGRNLYTWTDYSGLDPETNIEGAATFTRAEYMSVPPLRRFLATVNVRF